MVLVLKMLGNEKRMLLWKKYGAGGSEGREVTTVSSSRRCESVHVLAPNDCWYFKEPSHGGTTNVHSFPMDEPQNMQQRVFIPSFLKYGIIKTQKLAYSTTIHHLVEASIR